MHVHLALGLLRFVCAKSHYALTRTHTYRERERETERERRATDVEIGRLEKSHLASPRGMCGL
jgi:hypothetical protein